MHLSIAAHNGETAAHSSSMLGPHTRTHSVSPVRGAREAGGWVVLILIDGTPLWCPPIGQQHKVADRMRRRGGAPGVTLDSADSAGHPRAKGRGK